MSDIPVWSSSVSDGVKRWKCTSLDEYTGSREALVAAGHARAEWFPLVQPERHPGVVVRPMAEGTVDRTVFAATRASDAARPSVRALLDAVRDAVARVS